MMKSIVKKSAVCFLLMLATVMLIIACGSLDVNSGNNGGNGDDTEKITGGYANVLDFGANGEDTKDDYPAFLKAAMTDKTIFVPKGTYYLSATLELTNQNLIGEGMFQTKILSTDQSLSAVILSLGRTCTVTDLTIGFKPGIVNGSEGAGQRVGILTGNSLYSLQRGSQVSRVRINNVGTAIFSKGGEDYASFSVEYDTLEISNFSFRGIDFASKVRTGNVFTNIYMSSSYKVDSLFCMRGEESEVSITQLNLEHTSAAAAMRLSGVRALSIDTLHIEGIILEDENASLIELNNTSGSIEALSVYYCGFDAPNQSIFTILDGIYDINETWAQGNKPHTLSYLRIGTLHVKGLHDTNSKLHGPRPGLKELSGFNFFYRPQSAKGSFKVEIDNYVYFSFKDDYDIYDSMPGDPHDMIEFIRKGQIRTHGTTDERPTTRLCPYYSLYFDTDLNKLLLWTGSSWVYN